MRAWSSAFILAGALLAAGSGPDAAQVERKDMRVEMRRGFPDGAPVRWQEVSLPSRAGVRQRILTGRTAGAGCRAAVLFPGGRGKRVVRRRGGRIRLTNNFLMRASPLLARAGFIVALVPAPSDRLEDGMSDDFRASESHERDVRAVIDYLTGEGACGVFLLGASRGALSVAHLAGALAHPAVRGHVLAASVGDVIFRMGRIKGPVLMVHHIDDECRAADYSAARAAYRALGDHPRNGFVSVSGGAVPAGRACGPMSAHGFLGVERETMAAIAGWMNGGAPPAVIGE